MKTIPTLEATVARMKSEIRADVKAGIVPETVQHFSDLHDYVDANEYGGFCTEEVQEQLEAAFGPRANDDEGLLPEAALDFMNAAQDAIDNWLAGNVAGRLSSM